MDVLLFCLGDYEDVLWGEFLDCELDAHFALVDYEVLEGFAMDDHASQIEGYPGINHLNITITVSKRISTHK